MIIITDINIDWLQKIFIYVTNSENLQTSNDEYFQVEISLRFRGHASRHTEVTYKERR